MKRMTPKELTSDEISVLFRNKSKDGTYKPLGLFYHRNGTTVTGIDNSTGKHGRRTSRQQKNALHGSNKKMTAN